MFHSILRWPFSNAINYAHIKQLERSPLPVFYSFYPSSPRQFPPALRTIPINLRPPFLGPIPQLRSLRIVPFQSFHSNPAFVKKVEGLFPIIPRRFTRIYFPFRIHSSLKLSDAANIRLFTTSSRFTVFPLSRLPRRLLYAAGGISLVFVLSLVLLSATSPNSLLNQFAYKSYVFCYALVRVTRDIYTVIRIVIDYLWSLYGIDPDSSLYAAKIEEAHWRSAARLRDCFNANGGVYIKFGQHLAQMMYLLPDAYCQTMQSMLQQAPTSPFSDIEAIIKKETGHTINEVFSSFSRTPIASASLAQVHFATTVDDEDVAVKVQHRFLQHTVDADITVVNYIVSIVHWVFPSFDYGWLAHEMSHSLPKECNFLLEAENADITRNMLAHRDDVLIPKIHWNLSTPRLLVMERMNGTMVSNTAELVKQGLSLSEVSTLIAEVFSEMIFTHGRVHADPHPGNVYIGKYKQTNKPTLILFDHGLYSVISNEFRLKYAHLWHSLIFADKSKIKQYSIDMNAGDLYPLFAAMLTRRPWDDVTSHSLVNKRHQIEEFHREELQQYITLYGVEIQKILATVPQELVLLLKTNECLRHIDSLLGTSSETFLIMARFCTAAINEERRLKNPGIMTWIGNLNDTVSMELRIAAIEFVIRIGSLLERIKEWMGMFAMPWRFVLTRLRSRGGARN